MEAAESDESMETMTKRRKAQRELRSEKTAVSWGEEPEEKTLMFSDLQSTVLCNAATLKDHLGLQL